MPGFTKLWSETVTSSIWSEDDKTRIVWITMLAVVGPDGIVRASIGGLAHTARVSREACERAISIFEAPDPDSRSLENEGRRIQRVDGGFLILNYAKYREARNNDERSVYMTEYMREYRRKQKCKGVNVNVSLPLATLAKEEAEEEAEEEKKQNVKPSASPKGPTLTDDVFLSELKRHYPDIDIGRELHKMDAWLLTPKGKDRKRTRAFVVNWLNKIDTPMHGSNGKESKSGQWLTQDKPREEPISIEQQAEYARELANMKSKMNGAHAARE